MSVKLGIGAKLCRNQDLRAKMEDVEWKLVSRLVKLTSWCHFSCFAGRLQHISTIYQFIERLTITSLLILITEVSVNWHSGLFYATCQVHH